MASQAAPQLRSLYRRFLRELPLPTPTTTTPSIRTQSKPSILSHPSPTKLRIRSSFTPSSPTAPVETRIHEAEQFIQYLKAQRTYTTLIERYNPGANMDEEERVRLTARKVGMNLPIEFEVRPWGNSGRGGKGE